MKKLAFVLFFACGALATLAQKNNQIASKSHANDFSFMKPTVDSVMNFVTDPKMTKILETFDVDPKARETAEKDTRTYLASKGIKVPKNWDVVLLNHSWQFSGSGCGSVRGRTVCWKVAVSSDDGASLNITVK